MVTISPEPTGSHSDPTPNPRTPAFLQVEGYCPGCGGRSLFLAGGDGRGHVTCARLDCPAPVAVDQILHDRAVMRIALDLIDAAEGRKA